MGRDQRNNPFAKMRRVEVGPGPDAQKIYDSLGREVAQGDMIMFGGHPNLRWRVANIKPILHPQAPPGLLEVTFTAVIAVVVKGGTSQEDLIKIADYSEMQDFKREPAPASEAGAGAPGGGSVAQFPSGAAEAGQGAGAAPDTGEQKGVVTPTIVTPLIIPGS